MNPLTTVGTTTMQPATTMKLIDVSEGLSFSFCFFPRLLHVYTPK